ncbi:MAG: FAD-dependent oxidoreductase [Geminicoccaceae bacterium]
MSARPAGPAVAGQRIAVVGAGIVGVAAGLFLQEDGHSVTLVDPGEPGSGTSAGNAGIISVSSIMPIVTADILTKLPAMLADPVAPLKLRWRDLPGLTPWLLRAALATRKSSVERAMAGIQGLTSRALAAHEVLIQRAGAGELFASNGWLKVALDQARLEKGTAAERAALDRFGVAYEMLGRDAVLDLEPALSSEVKGALWLTANREIRQPRAYVERLAALFMERGGAHRRLAARGLAFADGRVTGVLTTEGRIEADSVVIAAGAFAGRLAADAGHRLPLRSERGYHLMLPTLATTLHRPVYCMDPGFVLAPMAHGLQADQRRPSWRASTPRPTSRSRGACCRCPPLPAGPRRAGGERVAGLSPVPAGQPAGDRPGVAPRQCLSRLRPPAYRPDAGAAHRADRRRPRRRPRPGLDLRPYRPDRPFW